MTLTNHIRRIEELANHVIVFVDAHEYSQAHSALDDIEAKCQAVHVHIDHLQSLVSLEHTIAADPESWIRDNISSMLPGSAENTEEDPK